MDHNHKLKTQRGAMTIVEAAFVFPIMFFIVFIMIMMGEAYYQHARVEYEVSHGAVWAAARCENPMLEYIQNNGNTVPKSPTAAKVVPYRYIKTDKAGQICKTLEGELTQKINSMKPLAFRAMSPKNVNLKVTPKLNVLVSSVKVECGFDIELPIRMVFSNNRLKFHYEVGTVEPVGDPTEFVRNVSTVQDIMERSETVNDIAGKIKDAMEKLARITN